MTRVFLCLSIVLIVAATGACGDVSDLLTDPSNGDRTTDRTVSSIEGESVAALLEVAQQHLRTDATGRFVRKVTYRPEHGAKSVIWRSTASYDIKSRRSRGTAMVTDPTSKQRRSIPFEFASEDRQRLVRISGWPCWVALRPDDVNGIAALNPTPGTVTLPGEIAALLLAEPTTVASDGSSDVIDALVPLRIAVGLVGGNTAYHHLTGRMAYLPIPAKIHLDAGRFVSWSVQGDDVVYGINAIGTPVEYDSDLGRSKVVVKLRDVGSVGPIEVPPRSDRVRLPPRAEDLDVTACERTIV